MSATTIRDEDNGDEFGTPEPVKATKSASKASKAGGNDGDDLLDSLGSGDPSTDEDELLDSVEESAEAWRPEEGEGIVGTVVKLGQVQSDYADQSGDYPICPVITVQRRDGEQRRIVGYSAVLRNELEDADPHVGDTLAAKYFGKQSDRKGKKQYHSYGVKVRRG